MTSVEQNLSRIEQEVPEWAPVVSCSKELGTSFDYLSLGYEEMAGILDREGYSREELKNLRIHFAAEGFWPKFGGMPHMAAFVSSNLLNGPTGAGFKQYIEEEITGIDHKELEDKSFVFIFVNQVMQAAREKGSDEAEVLRETLIHETLHFTEYLKHGSRELLELLKKPGLNQYAISDLKKHEEMRVFLKEGPIIALPEYKNLVRAVLHSELGA